jgi:hypothetical protein
VRFRGKLSPAFDNRWFSPSPPKKKSKPAVSYDKELFPMPVLLQTNDESYIVDV